MCDIYIVFPTRISAQQEILPDVHMEDWLAILNLLDNIPQTKPVKLRSVNLVGQPLGAHYVSVCSSKSNRITAELLQERKGRPFSFVPEPADPTRWCLMEHGRPPTYHRSRSYDQVKRYRSRKMLPVGPAKLDDIALAACFPNPHDEKYRVLIVAGVRGIGTWGAAKHIARQWQWKVDDLFDPSAADFFQLLDVTYKNFKVQKVEPHTCSKLCS